MKLKVLLLALIIAVIAATSCQKEVNWSPDLRTSNNDSTLISRVILLDTTLPSHFDSIYYYQFEYDQQKRVAFIYEFDKSGPVVDTYVVTHLFYQGNDTLPYKGISRFDLSTNVEELFKYYDGSGKLVKDSFIKSGPPGGIEVRRYSYLTGRLKINWEWWFPSVGVHDSSTSYMSQVRNGNNILSQKDTIDDTNSGGGFYTSSFNYQYDKHPNPFKKGWHYFPFYQYRDILSDNFSDNNFTDTYAELKDHLTGTTNITHYQYAYQYNANGFPKIAWEKDVDNGTVDKYVYVYTK